MQTCIIRPKTKLYPTFVVSNFNVFKPFLLVLLPFYGCHELVQWAILNQIGYKKNRGFGRFFKFPQHLGCAAPISKFIKIGKEYLSIQSLKLPLFLYFFGSKGPNMKRGFTCDVFQCPSITLSSTEGVSRNSKKCGSDKK